MNESACEKCGDWLPVAEMVDVSFRGPDGEVHERYLCEDCHQEVMDEALSHMGDYE